MIKIALVSLLSLALVNAGVPERVKAVEGNEKNIVDDFKGVSKRVEAVEGIVENKVDDFKGVPEKVEAVEGNVENEVGDFKGVPEGVEAVEGNVKNEVDDSKGVPERVEAVEGNVENKVDDSEEVSAGVEAVEGNVEIRVDDFKGTEVPDPSMSTRRHHHRHHHLHDDTPMDITSEQSIETEPEPASIIADTNGVHPEVMRSVFVQRPKNLERRVDDPYDGVLGVSEGVEAVGGNVENKVDDFKGTRDSDSSISPRRHHHHHDYASIDTTSEQSIETEPEPASTMADTNEAHSGVMRSLFVQRPKSVERKFDDQYDGVLDGIARIAEKLLNTRKKFQSGFEDIIVDELNEVEAILTEKEYWLRDLKDFVENTNRRLRNIARSRKY